jgi:hypothetical protein
MEAIEMRTLKRNQYFQLAGLLALAAEHVVQLEKIQKAAEALTGERSDRSADENNHTGTAVWSGETPESGLDFLVENRVIAIEK